MSTNFFNLILFCLSFFCTSFSANAWSPFGPNNYDDCIIKNMKGVTSDRAANLIRHSCRQKFPLPNQVETQVQATRYGFPRLDIWDKPYNNKVFGNVTISKTKINSHGGLEMTITNKNDFSLNGLYIGITADKKSSKCPLEKVDYIEIHECQVDIYPNTTKSAICKNPSGMWCVVGLKADFQTDLDKFFRDVAK
jgi:hypothetical protein